MGVQEGKRGLKRQTHWQPRTGVTLSLHRALPEPLSLLARNWSLSVVFKGPRNWAKFPDADGKCLLVRFQNLAVIVLFLKRSFILKIFSP